MTHDHPCPECDTSHPSMDHLVDHLTDHHDAYTWTTHGRPTPTSTQTDTDA